MPALQQNIETLLAHLEAKQECHVALGNARRRSTLVLGSSVEERFRRKPNSSTASLDAARCSDALRLMQRSESSGLSY
jgi:hypothetical protein